MKAKLKKEIQELIEENLKVPCCSAEATVKLEQSKFFRLDELAKKDLFYKVKGELPKVYLEATPIIVLPFDEWITRITKKNLINTSLDENLLKLFDNLTVEDVKEYFINVLYDYFYETCEKERKRLNEILKDGLESKKG